MAGPKQRLANYQRKMRMERDAVVRDGAAIAAPFLVGVGEAKGFKLPTFQNLNPDLLYGAGGVLVSMGLSGTAKRVIRGSSIGLLSCAAKTLGRTGKVRMEGAFDAIDEDDDSEGLEDFE